MNEHIRNYLLEKAHRGQMVWFEDLVADCGLPLDLSQPSHRSHLVDQLNAVARHEHQQGRPLLAAITKHKNQDGPGPAFYHLAEELGYGPARQLEEEEFVLREVQRVHEYWKNTAHFEAGR